MNRKLMTSLPKPPAADAVNQAGGKAYALSPEHALAQYAMTGTLHGDTFYATVEKNLEVLQQLCAKVADEYLAKCAVYVWEQGFMKDTSAFLTACLSKRNPALFRQVFPRTIVNGKQFSTFFQVMRSGQAGRKSLGSCPKNLMRQWLTSRTPLQVLKASVGVTPSFRDILRALHPKAKDAAQNAMFGYLSGTKKPVVEVDFPEELTQLLAFRADATKPCPKLPFLLLTSSELTTDHWKQIALSASWQTIRMNLATFARHGVLKDKAIVARLGERLVDRAEIARSRVFPYQLYMAYQAVAQNAEVPQVLKEAVQDAMDASFDNLPVIEGDVLIFVDVSGSMSSPITGRGNGHSSAVRCVDVAALFGAGLMRRARSATIWAFDKQVYDPMINRRDSIATNAAKLAQFGGGGTMCSLPMQAANARGLKADLVVYVSDSESWMLSSGHGTPNQGTETMAQWFQFLRRSPKAKMVCLDIQPTGAVQAVDSGNVLNLGGFSDRFFTTVSNFLAGNAGPQFWVQEIQKVELSTASAAAQAEEEAPS